MLVLTRNRDQSLVIQCGSEIITITVTDIRGDKVRLGCNASREVKVDREEIYRDKQRNGNRATNLFQGMSPPINNYSLGGS